MYLSEKETKFLIGLEKLTRETGIVIFGCGCCSSPSLSEVKITDERSSYGFGYASEVYWIDPSDHYAWENFSKSIIKQA